MNEVIYWNKFVAPLKQSYGTKEKVDNNIYTFDIETNSFLELDGEIHPAIDYDHFTKKEQERCIFHSCMYIWQFGVNDLVYYGRTWEEFVSFIQRLDEEIPERKIVFVHNLAFEFQFLKSVFQFTKVMARKSRKVMKCELQDYNFEFRCSLMMTNVSLEKLSEVYSLPIEKQVGSLEYELIRTKDTPLTKKELKYCEYDCLVVYEYIKMELSIYKQVSKIPLTSTGHVRRELKDRVKDDYKYKRLVKKASNINPHVYNLMLDAFTGGYTHANRLFAAEIHEDVDSYDFTSSYPFVMVTRKYPSTTFRYCHIKKREDMLDEYAYLLVVKFKNVKSKYHNTFISKSKCRHIKNGVYDNGRIISADEFEMTLTDIDFKLYLDCYSCKYEIKEAWYSIYDYLPKVFIEFILEKYKMKTEYKGVEDKKIEYALSKAMVNSLYGMTVTNTIKDEVEYDNIAGWSEVPLSNDEIQNALYKEREKAFLSFSWGVWVTAYARNNLIRNVMKCDDYAIYMDTDSIKLKNGYNKKIFEDYNDSVMKLISSTCKILNIGAEYYSPKDIKGKEHTLGLFDYEGKYDRFITQGAKKYAFEKDGKIGITVSGVPKKGAKALKRLEDFDDHFVFRYADTGKNMLAYIEEQEPIEIKDFQGRKSLVTDKTGVCFLPTTYELSKSDEYADLLNDSSNRARYKE